MGNERPTYPIPTPVTIPEMKGRSAMTKIAGMPAFASSIDAACARSAALIKAENRRMPT
ncbi:MAG: hypothetical protein ACPLYX_10235, partial [Rectinema subterraneum]|uniref:hypothetical protein n=1 Tax=Rectinema subterraneum TaxID=2653714 RepID=UPI003C7A3886